MNRPTNQKELLQMTRPQGEVYHITVDGSYKPRGHDSSWLAWGIHVTSGDGAHCFHTGSGRQKGSRKEGILAAELLGVVAAFDWLKANTRPGDEVTIYTDCLGLVRYLNGGKARGEASALNLRHALARYVSLRLHRYVQVVWVPRRYTKPAHYLATSAMNQP